MTTTAKSKLAAAVCAVALLAMPVAPAFAGRTLVRRRRDDRLASLPARAP